MARLSVMYFREQNSDSPTYAGLNQETVAGSLAAAPSLEPQA
jgi:hypothetical protein